MIREPGFSINRKDIFERLFSDYYGILVCYAQKYTKREDIAEDIVQDVFASLWEENRIFPSQANFRSFLYISIRNAAFDYLRHQNVESRYIEEALTANRFLSDDSFQKEEVFRLLLNRLIYFRNVVGKYSCYIWKVMIMMLLLKNYRCQ